ncbi:magnesium and cobalt transport protein CorA [candidate division WOR-1 bacterium RIFOXYC2_FULL_37_10]|uniref:Magnesium transport protein CorA n=1 Tax=candidate division WOR-1 bacterium RIFOXYB2_FULL_37_13 TaxID=1802579 RepID=A0A1F4SH52_UNCSA|nr:MAG: magnesium and cobalt transport protein CorA [candidate division WOR-1 bacterium RIFOXYA2_FULL_37_7]OGC19750.1 MAG: magnesium and cobalt transport protein CorA [candidate division WOR-1 bacterium RIFOXYB2_FULL_37_13]OGC33180.1 MAG: magnesium and cobalt transport protein CorA [candidate division WOR-1 bacterium RIFOXYC2_FULL_37_10]
MASEQKITIYNYNKDNYSEENASFDECINYKDKSGITWIDVKDVNNEQLLEKISNCYNLHQLVRESLLEQNKRSKIEDHGNYLFILLTTMSYSAETDEVFSEAVDLILGDNYIITFSHGTTISQILEPTKKRIRTEGTRLRESGTDYLAYRIIDALIDNYFNILKSYGEKVEILEEEIFNRGEKELLLHIQKLRRDMLSIRESIWPLREVLNSLQRGESRLIRPETRIYLRDVYEHTVQIMENLETSRDITASMLEVYLSTVNNKINEVMKVLTVFSTIFMPLTFISSIYGMNFHYMPELTWRYGYFAVWGSILIVVFSMLAYFRKKRWF